MSASGRSGGKGKKKHEKGADAGKPGRGTGSQLTGNLTSSADGSRSQQGRQISRGGNGEPGDSTNQGHSDVDVPPHVKSIVKTINVTSSKVFQHICECVCGLSAYKMVPTLGHTYSVERVDIDETPCFQCQNVSLSC